MNFLKNLIGGQIVKGYSISGDPVTGIGHHKQWKLYKGKKDSTGGQVSIFVLEKKSLKPNLKQDIIKNVKKQVSTLAKIRHPGVIALIEPLSQDEQHMSFVTERIEGNLSSIIRQKKFDQYVSSQLELKLSLFPLLEAINFLHEIVKLCHLGLSLESIYITAEGKWKIGGMNYAQVLTGQQFQVLQNTEFYDYLHLPLEVVKENKFNKFSDSYSLGILFINFMFLLKKTPNNLMQLTQTKQLYFQNSKTYRQYPQFPAILQSVAPQQLIQLLSQLLIDQSTYRLQVSSLQSSKWINDPIVLTVKYLQKISNYQNKQQVQFLKGLSGVIDKFSGKILHKRIIPILTNLLKFNHLVASIIFIVLDIMKKNMISIQQWRKNVWSQLKSITQGKQMTAQSLYLLISNMQILQKYVNEQHFMSCIIPLYLKCFDCPPKLKLLALRHVQRLTKKYDYQFTKTKIVPKLVVSMKDQKIQIRKDTLKALYAIINRLDPHTIVNVVLAGLQNCRKAGADPFINAITVQLYNKITTNMSAQVLATKIMPGLMPYLIDPSIEQQQFGLYKNAMFNMINKIQDQRKKTWNQQSSTNNGLSQKFNEKDFILQKVEIQSANGSTSNFNVGNDVRFDFLNEYKSIGSSSNIGGNANQQQNKINDQLQFKPTQLTANQSNSLSFGFQAPQQTINQKVTSLPKVESYNEQITITDHSFGSQFKSNYQMGFGDSISKIQTNLPINNQNNNKNEWNYQPAKIKNQGINRNVESNDSWDMNKFSNSFTKPSEYKPPAFDFSTTTFTQVNNNQNNNNTFSFENPNIFNQSSNKHEFKQLPFSPSTQPQLNQTSKPQLKGLNDSGNKKLVGPAQGGLKKPPKYNQFNMPLSQQKQVGIGNVKKQSSMFTTTFNNEFTPIIPASNNFSNNAFFNQPTPAVFGKSNTSTFKSPDNTDDPFAQVEQFNISNKTSNILNINPTGNNNINLNFGNLTTNNTKSNDPFDDLL